MTQDGDGVGQGQEFSCAECMAGGFLPPGHEEEHMSQTFMVFLRSKCLVAQRKRGNLGAVSGKGNLAPIKGKRAVEFQGRGGREKKKARSGALATVLLNPE